MTEWMKELDDRQRKEVEFARLYAGQFGHGTDGHNRLLLIAKLATLLDDGYGELVAIRALEWTPEMGKPKKPPLITD
jgi:hypothetical protein